VLQDVIDKNKRERLDLLQQAYNNVELQQWILAKCEKDPLWWFEHFMWVYEPRNKERVLPFVPYNYESDLIKETIKHIEVGQDLFVDKSRDMGVSWTELGVALWGFRFKQWSGLIGSRKQEEVDTLGDLSTLFPKLRFMWYRMPQWMRFEILDSWMKMASPETGAALTGESTNPNFGTGGRYKFALLDEFSKWAETAWSAWTSLAQATPCRIPVSTPYGSGTKQAELRETPIDQMHLHWTLHPSKSIGLYNTTAEQKKEAGLKGGLVRSPWYDNECLRMSDEEIAQELDINYERSAGGRVYGNEWDQLVAERRIRRLEYNPELPTFSFWDFGIGDNMVCGIAQVGPMGEAVYVIDHYESNNEPIEHYYNWLMDHKTEDGKSWEFAGHYGDIAGKQRNLITGRSVFEWLNDHGVTIEARKTDEIDEKHAVQTVLPKTMIDDRLVMFQKAFNNFHYEWDMLKGEYKDKPHHDKYSHTPKAFAYFCVNHFEPKTKETPVERHIRRLQEETDSSINTEYQAI